MCNPPMPRMIRLEYNEVPGGSVHVHLRLDCEDLEHNMISVRFEVTNYVEKMESSGLRSELDLSRVFRTIQGTLEPPEATKLFYKK